MGFRIQLSSLQNKKELGISNNKVSRALYEGKLVFIKELSERYSERLAKLELCNAVAIKRTRINTPTARPLYNEKNEFCGIVTEALNNFKDMYHQENINLKAEQYLEMGFVEHVFIRIMFFEEDDLHPGNLGTYDPSIVVDGIVLAEKPCVAGIDFDMCAYFTIGKAPAYKGLRSTDYIASRNLDEIGQIYSEDLSTFPVLKKMNPCFDPCKKTSLLEPSSLPSNYNLTKGYLNADEFIRLADESFYAQTKRKQAIATIRLLMINPAIIENDLSQVLDLTQTLDQEILAIYMKWFKTRQMDLRREIIRCRWFHDLLLTDKSFLNAVLEDHATVFESESHTIAFRLAYYQLWTEVFNYHGIYLAKIQHQLVMFKHFIIKNMKPNPASWFGLGALLSSSGETLDSALLNKAQETMQVSFNCLIDNLKNFFYINTEGKALLSEEDESKIKVEYQQLFDILEKNIQISYQHILAVINKDYFQQRKALGDDKKINPPPDLVTITCIFNDLWDSVKTLLSLDIRITDPSDLLERTLILNQDMTKSFILETDGFSVVNTMDVIISYSNEQLAHFLKDFLSQECNKPAIRKAAEHALLQYLAPRSVSYQNSERCQNINKFIEKISGTHSTNLPYEVLKFIETSDGWVTSNSALESISFNPCLIAQLCLEMPYIHIEQVSSVQERYSRFFTNSKEISTEFKKVLDFNNPYIISKSLVKFLSEVNNKDSIITAINDAEKEYLNCSWFRWTYRSVAPLLAKIQAGELPMTAIVDFTAIEGWNYNCIGASNSLNPILMIKLILTMFNKSADKPLTELKLKEIQDVVILDNNFKKIRDFMAQDRLTISVDEPSRSISGTLDKLGFLSRSGSIRSASPSSEHQAKCTAEPAP
jgi:hypothetical protein